MTTLAAEQQTRASLLDSQRRVLERIANGAPLREILETLVRLIEEQADGMRRARPLAPPHARRPRDGLMRDRRVPARTPVHARHRDRPALDRLPRYRGAQRAARDLVDSH